MGSGESADCDFLSAYDVYACGEDVYVGFGGIALNQDAGSGVDVVGSGCGLGTEEAGGVVYGHFGLESGLAALVGGCDRQGGFPYVAGGQGKQSFGREGEGEDTGVGGAGVVDHQVGIADFESGGGGQVNGGVGLAFVHGHGLKLYFRSAE